jgi:hypothetical protein
MSIAYVFTVAELEVAEHFLNRFLKAHCREATGQSPYIASLRPSAEKLASQINIDVDTIIDAEEYRSKLLKPMYSGLSYAIQANRPVVSLRNNLSRQSRQRFLEKIPTNYERISVAINPLRFQPSINEGFDKCWVIDRQPLGDDCYKYEFLKGSMSD